MAELVSLAEGVALGHSIGCSGARILGTLARELRRRGGRRWLAVVLEA